VWDNVPPRVLNYLLERAQKWRSARLLDLLTVYHGEPKKVQTHLRKEAQSVSHREKSRRGDGFAAMAANFGDHRTAQRMRREDRVLAFLERERKVAEA